MTEPAENRLVVELERTGEQFQVLRYSISSSYLVPSDGWEFTVYSQNDPVGLRRKFAPLRRVKLYVDGHLQVIGRIDETEGASDAGALTVRGRDYVAEIVDGGADPSMRFTAKQDLGDALLMLFRPYGVRTLVGNWNLTRNLLTGRVPYVGEPTRSFKTAKLEDFKISANSGTYGEADKIVARHGYTIQQGGDRTIMAIVEPQFGQSAIGTLSRPGALLSGRAKRSYADIPTVTISTGRGVASNPGASADPIRDQFPSFGELAPNELVTYPEVKRIVGTPDESDELFDRRFDWKAKTAPFEAEDFVLYRPMFYEDKDARTKEQLTRGIRRELSRRLKSTLEYSCSVRGHTSRDTGAIWSIDTMANIRDEIEDVDELMWCLERTLRNDGGGPKTDMTWIRAGSIAL